ncbi:MAG: copper chaperone PCu(A)C [Cohaesibacter sp.]|nr:copper chaperone PCu(A)C [Cohaesibacter sp.]MCV6601775.1 copper chaperone PCu(A)C [Cohaesibacter sp.]
MQSNNLFAMLIASALSLTAFTAYAGSGAKHDHHKHGEHKHETHKSEFKGIHALHGWMRESHKGENGLVFVELDNRSDATVIFKGGEASNAQSVELVGFQLKDGAPKYLPINKPVPIKAGRHLDLAPKAIALRLNALSQDYHKGESFEMDLVFDRGEMHVTIEIEADNATQHSHAGHNHD